MPFGLGFGEMLLIVAVLLLLFGAKRLPEVAQGMGKGIRDFKRAINGLDGESIQGNEAKTPPVQAQPDREVPAAAPPQVQAPMAAQPQPPREQPVSTPVEAESRATSAPAETDTRSL
jgi:sec-independent protein translocase protein TatA